MYKAWEILLRDGKRAHARLSAGAVEDDGIWPTIKASVTGSVQELSAALSVRQPSHHRAGVTVYNAAARSLHLPIYISHRETARNQLSQVVTVAVIFGLNNST